MKISYFPDQMALKSDPVWTAFLSGIKQYGYEPVENSWKADCAVIWSVLWQGRLRPNLAVFDFYRKQGKPVFIIEVGSLLRGKTWKVALNNITIDGIYPNTKNLDLDRSKFLGLNLETAKTTRPYKVLIAAQHQNSLQWTESISVPDWTTSTIKQIRAYTDMPIVVRPHPRFNFGGIEGKRVTIENPIMIPNTYDVYNINYNYRCVINYNSGVGIQSAIAGTPVIVNQSSLASEISSSFEDIENCQLPNREQWFQKILHTEWTVEELAQGIPQGRLHSELTS